MDLGSSYVIQKPGCTLQRHGVPRVCLLDGRRDKAYLLILCSFVGTAQEPDADEAAFGSSEQLPFTITEA